MATTQQTQGVIVTPVTATGVQLVPNVSSGSLSLTGTPSDGDKFTITLSNLTAFAYTFKTALTPTAGEVLIGGSAAAAILNLFNAMTGGPGSGTLYAAGTTICANQTTAAMLAVVLSGQKAMRALTPNASNVITLYNGIGWGFTLALTVNASGFLAKSDFAALTGDARRGGYLHIVNVRPNSANATLQLYDSAQVTGVVTGNTLSLVDAQTPWSNAIDYNGRKPFVNGVYAVLTSAGSVGSFEVTYE